MNFAEIHHRVASITLEIPATFTRHHAFLKKATQKLSCGSLPSGEKKRRKNFHPVRVVRLGGGGQNFREEVFQVVKLFRRARQGATFFLRRTCYDGSNH